MVHTGPSPSPSPSPSPILPFFGKGLETGILMDFLYFSRVRMGSHDVFGEFSDTGNLEGGIGKLELKLETGKGD